MGAPIGSVLLGSKEHIEKALRIRKLFGGAMRQVGYLAAAGIYALDHHVERLADDHLRAKTIAEVLQKSEFVKFVEPVETNIVIFNINENISESTFMERFEQQGISFITMGNGKLRMVTHLDFTDEMLAILIHTIDNF